MKKRKSNKEAHQFYYSMSKISIGLTGIERLVSTIEASKGKTGLIRGVMYNGNRGINIYLSNDDKLLDEYYERAQILLRHSDIGTVQRFTLSVISEAYSASAPWCNQKGDTS